MSTFAPVTVEAQDESLTVSTYRTVLGGQHLVHVASTDGASHYLAPEQALEVAVALMHAAYTAQAAERREAADA